MELPLGVGPGRSGQITEGAKGPDRERLRHDIVVRYCKHYTYVLFGGAFGVSYLATTGYGNEHLVRMWRGYGEALVWTWTLFSALSNEIDW